VPKPVVIATFPYRYQAEYARQILTGAGIRSALLADDAAGMYAGLTFTNPARVVVHPEDRVEAERLLHDHGVLGGDGDSGSSAEDDAADDAADDAGTFGFDDDDDAESEAGDDAPPWRQ
jgi:hypothetical protein